MKGQFKLTTAVVCSKGLPSIKKMSFGVLKVCKMLHTLLLGKDNLETLFDGVIVYIGT